MSYRALPAPIDACNKRPRLQPLDLYGQVALPGPLLGSASSVLTGEFAICSLMLSSSGTTDHLVKTTLPNLQILDISFMISNLSSEHFAVLANGIWPKTQDLSLGCNQLNPAALSAIVQGSWPL